MSQASRPRGIIIQFSLGDMSLPMRRSPPRSSNYDRRRADAEGAADFSNSERPLP